MKKLKYILLSISFVGVLVGASFVFPIIVNSYNSGINDEENEKDKTEEKEESKSENQNQKEEQVILANDFTAVDINGKDTKLSSFIGKPVVVNFWATWCIYCEQELPAFEKLFNLYKDKVEFMIVDLVDGLSETQEVAKQFIQERNYTFPLYFDKDYSAYDAYNCYEIPRTLFINKNGSLNTLYIGMMTESVLKQYIDKITA